METCSRRSCPSHHLHAKIHDVPGFTWNERRDGLVRDVLARKAMGLAKYGTHLTPHNGRDANVDAYQECLDMLAYLMQHEMEG